MARRVLLFMLLAAVAGLAQTVNCVVAIVNGEIITRLDVEVAVEFGLGQDPAAEPGADPRMAALDALIGRKIVLALARDVRGVSGEELDAAVSGLRQALGEDAYAAKLAKFGLADKDIAAYLEDRILYERALALRFSQSIPVSVTEVERNYRDIYVPEQARLGAAAEPIDRVAGALESRIRNERRAHQTADWIRDLRSRTAIQIKKDCLK